jgi:hypothetical protein
MKSIVAIIFLLVFGTIGVKVSLAYADKYTIISAIAAVDKNTKLSDLADAEIADILIREFRKNGIDYIKPDDLIIVADPDNKEVQVSLEYDIKVTLIANIGFELPMAVKKDYLAD